MDSATAALFADAVRLHRQGALAEAAERYARVLRDDPRNADALYALAQIACQQGRFADGVEFSRQVLAIQVLAIQVLAIEPQRARAHNLLGMALARLGRPQEALASFDLAIAYAPELADAHGNRGDVLAELGRPADAVASYDRALQIAPDSIETWCNRGATLHDLGRYADALASYDRAIALKPAFAEVHLNRGNTLVLLGRHDEALASFQHVLAVVSGHLTALMACGDTLRKLARHDEALASYRTALAIDPCLVDAHIGCGAALVELKRRDEALASVESALVIEPDNVNALNNRGFLLNALTRRDEALASLEQALRIDPTHAEALNNRGVVLSGLGLHEPARTSFDQVLAVSPDHLGALCNRAKALNMLRRYVEALASAERALAVAPRHAEAHFTRGNTLVRLGRDADAIAAFEQTLAVDPQHPRARAALAACRLANCDWEHIAWITAELDHRMAEPGTTVSPLTLLQLNVPPAKVLAWTRRYVEQEVPRVAALPRARSTRNDGRIRLAYLSCDFRQHPVSYLTAELFERHDRARFEVFGISFGPDDRSDIRARMERAFDRFEDVATRGDIDVVRLLRDLDVDVAVDLCGHTEGARPSILAYRPAPIAVNYLGYPGTMGADFIDYVIGDPVVLPFDQQPHYAEKIVQLPECYLVNDRTKAISAGTPTRTEAGLPDGAFVFCCFNNSFKISAVMFDLWMRLLGTVENSVLWLSQMNAGATANLRAAASARGIDPARLVFAPRAPQMADHLARHRLADLFVDTLPYNAHTTASDALWAGLPVLTCQGESFAGRVAASQLQAVGLPELVTTSLTDYERLARKLASEPALLQSIRQKLARNRPAYPLFDTDRFRRHMEAAYAAMVDIHRRGEPPRSFRVDPV
jgi:protein O-GlcNAc transferase